MSQGPFSAGSRYANVPIAEMTLPDGRQARYLLRRLPPDPARFTPLTHHRARQVDRLDWLADRYLGDPLRFWQLCDANAVIHPAELLRAGRLLTVPYPLEAPGDGFS